MVCPEELGGISAHVEMSNLFGFPVCAGQPQEILDLVWDRMRARQTTHIVTLNPEIVVMSEDQPEIAELLHRADVVVADGQGVCWAAKRFGLREIQRYPGIDLVHDLMERMSQDGMRVFLLGSGPGVAALAGRRLEDSLPGLVVTGTADGYFDWDQGIEIVKQIKLGKPDLLLVGMGCPRQDRFIVEYRESLNIPVMVGVGGALEVFSGKLKRAPLWIRRWGLEWVYRGLINFTRLRRLMVLPRFIGMTISKSFRRTE